MSFGLHKVAMVALLMGSAILLFSCKEEEQVVEESLDTIKTESGENITMVMSENGRRSYLFTAPLLEGYTLGRDPYREFRKGISITTYQNDSLTIENTNLVANYAIYYEKRKLWEARGDVVVIKDGGNRRLETQQLFWNSVTKRIYSNVDTKLISYKCDENGVPVVNEWGEHIIDEIQGEGFESDEEMNEPRFRRWTSRMYVDAKNLQEEDDAKATEPAAEEEKESDTQLVKVPKTEPAPTTKNSPPAPKKAPGKSPKMNARAPKTGNPFVEQNSSSEADGAQAMQRRKVGAAQSAQPAQKAKSPQKAK
jgi:LPS export ABC transporter protein LptC